MKSPYLKPGSEKQPGGYLKYIATREGVEMAEDTSRHLPATAQQQKQITKLVKQHPDNKDTHEYEDYIANSTRSNADAFINSVSESPQRDVYLKYISERPGVEKVGSNGLFTDEGVPIVMSQVQKEMNEHPGNIWTHIISLHREDAERLGYNTPDAWMHLLRSQRNMIAQQMKIAPENFRWYAAFHNEGHHPHVHMMAYSVDPNEAYLTKKGIEHIKSALAKEIFRNDLLHIYKKQTDFRDSLRHESVARLAEITAQINCGSFHDPVMEQLLVRLADKLAQTGGKKQYGYLNQETKKLVDQVVARLAEEERIQELYSLWYDLRDDVLRTYTDTFPERIPLEQNKEFKSIRNAVVQVAIDIDTPETVSQADGYMERDEIFDSSSDRFAEDSPEEPPPSRHSRPRVPTSNWWSDEYRIARLKQAGGADSPPMPEEAYRLMLAEAERGNGLAMHDVGRMLLTGQGCARDEEAAQEWFMKAYNAFFQMEQNAKDPGYWQYRIGRMHAMGYGVDQDDAEAAEWYEQAVEWRNPFAACALGSMYYHGQGVAKDDDEAYGIFKLAAEHPFRPNAYAQFQLGRMCSDPEESEKWYRMAYQGFLCIEQKLPDDKLYYRLGYMNLHGLGTDKDLEKAEMYFNKAAILGNVDAVYGMGKLCLETEPERAIRYFELAAKQGHTYAEYQLGKIYCFGIGVPRDLETGMEWLRLSAEHGNEHASTLLQHVNENLAASATWSAFSLLGHLAQMIRNDGEHQYRVRNHTDSKLKSKIAEKKRLHGQKHQEEYQSMQL